MSMRMVETPILSIGCFITGPEDGLPLVLLHGWPDDATCWEAMLPALNEAGYRIIVPYLRGCGPTRFLRDDTMRSGEMVAMAQDLFDLADALNLGRFAVVGHDWGARIAYIAAALRPERITAIAALSVGWNGNDPDAPISLQQQQSYWYQWLMATPRGVDLVENQRRSFTNYIWYSWNPNWTVPEDMFRTAAAAFSNPDWASITLHSYRVRWKHAEPDPAYAAQTARVIDNPVISVPTLMIQGAIDPCALPSSSENKESLFSARYDRVVLDGIGHFPQRQAPERVLEHLLPFLAEIGKRG
ncbi:alpha/beta hydrolase [Acetobacteraceae bacterium KSS8]|uniref:Alpha/beta hydrolase n=1 Tax=Endosaccharibacter trunci TaxID=2812733 RepID=A0ABT1WBI5_9PROT|nr:alpha/beta hydrolase [Acetobacteraceae bacterium KSS8]